MISRSLLTSRFASRQKLSAFLRALSVACAASLSAGCGGEGDDDNGEPPPGPSVTIPITDANQYTSEAELTIPIVEAAAAVDISISWAQVTSNLQCKPFDPADARNVSFLRFEGMTEDEVEDELVKARLDSDLATYWDHNVAGGETDADLSTFERLGNTPIDVDTDFVAGFDGTYLAIVQDSLGLGVGTQSMVFVTPVEEGPLVVEIPPGCAPDAEILEFLADIDKPKVPAPAEAPWIVGWTGVNKDGTGGDIAFTGMDQLLLGFYPGMDTAALEDDFFNIEELANPMWELEINGPDLKGDLSNARKRNADGSLSSEKFAGFDSTNGTWMVALMCTTCANPQPVVLAILDPSGG
jgi:hypothetical protein